MGVVQSKEFKELIENVFDPWWKLGFTSSKHEVEKLYREFLRHRRILDNRLEEFRTDFLDKLDR